MTIDGFEFRLLVSHSQVSTTMKEVDRHGGQVRSNGPFKPKRDSVHDDDGTAFEPLTVIACVATVPWLTNWVMTLVKNTRRSGVIVDATGSSPLISVNKNIDPGLILIIDSNGSRVVDTRQSVEPPAILSKLFGS